MIDNFLENNTIGSIMLGITGMLVFIITIPFWLLLYIIYLLFRHFSNKEKDIEK